MAGHVETTGRAGATAGGLKRRGLIAGAAALALAVAARVAPDERVAAGVDGDVILGASNSTGSQTGITNTTASSTAVFFSCTGGYDGWGIDSTASGYGVIGRSNTPGTQTGGAGVYGETTRADSYGMRGYNSASSGTPVAVYGIASASYGVGVSGLAKTGVLGQSNTGPGVFGGSGGGPGVYGGTVVTGQGGVSGYSATSGAFGIQGTAGSANTFAAAFFGTVAVNGQFTVYGGPKNAAVPHPDGTHRLLYSVESPEAWFEDFGEGTITGGKAEVKLDPDFAAVVDTAKLHVFCMPHDETHHLAVKARNGGSFSVAAGLSGEAVARGVKAADIHGTFSYRVVAKRKDIKGERLAKFTLPQPASATPLHPLVAAAPPAPPTRKS